METNTGDAQAVWAFTEHEHRELARGINRIHDVACEIGRRSNLELSVDVLNVLQWLDSTLGPHIAWEEAWLYPQIDARLGTPWATRAARFDHRQVREMIERLRADQHLQRSREATEQQAESRCHLFSLEALLRAHLEREERFLIPILEDNPSGKGPAEPNRSLGTPGQG
jgi:hemerythrin-like domain-containing protein